MNYTSTDNGRRKAWAWRERPYNMPENLVFFSSFDSKETQRKKYVSVIAYVFQHSMKFSSVEVANAHLNHKLRFSSRPSTDLFRLHCARDYLQKCIYLLFFHAVFLAYPVILFHNYQTEKVEEEHDAADCLQWDIFDFFIPGHRS